MGGGFLEEAPPTTEIQAVLAWARARADRVYVRPRWAPDTYYWAGDPTLRPPDVPLLRVPS